jgi:CBS domain-containing protein
MENTLVRDVMVARPKTMPATASVADVRQTFANPHVISALLVDATAFAGVIARGAIPDTVPDDASARDFASTDVPTIRPDMPVADAVAMLDADGERRLVVLDEDGATLAGLLCLDESRTGFCGTGSQHS